jgi:hypothetical protein
MEDNKQLKAAELREKAAYWRRKAIHENCTASERVNYLTSARRCMLQAIHLEKEDK